jgi:multidrug efflux system membrane fusion protein
MTPQIPPARKRRTWLVLVIAILAVGGLGTIWYVNHSGPPIDQSRGGRRGGGGGGGGRFGGQNGPLPVIVQAAAKGDIDVYLDGLGTVTPLATVTLRTQINGLLMQVAFQEGQMVNKGDLLAVIDPRPYQVALEQAQGQQIQAQAQLAEAEADLDRYTKLSEQDSIAKQQVDAQRALVDQDRGLVQTDQAAIDSAKLNLSYCHVTAPVSGRVGLRQVDAGNYVTPGDSNGLVVLTQVKPITVIFTLPEDNVPDVAARLHAGAAIPVEAFDRTESRKLATGTLTTIDNLIDTTTGTFKLRATFANDDETLFPSQFVNVHMLLDVEKDVLVIPSSGVERGSQGTYVYLVKDDSTVTARAVTLGKSEDERVEVTSGLAPGDRIVVDGADKLKEGMDVIVQEPPAEKQGVGDPASSRRRRHRSGDGGNAPAGGAHPAAPAASQN